MIRSLTAMAMTGVAAVLAACTTNIKVPEIPMLDQPNPIVSRHEPEHQSPPAKVIQYVEVPKPLPLPGQLKPVAPKDDPPKQSLSTDDRIKAANAAARLEPAKDGFINAIQVYPYTVGALYQVYAAVGEITDIALEPQEKLIAVSAGDTVRWVVGDTTSGEGASLVVHILVKPIGADLETNLVITTARRTYHLELRSLLKTYMASVSWSYPEAGLIALNGRKQRVRPFPADTARLAPHRQPTPPLSLVRAAPTVITVLSVPGKRSKRRGPNR